MKTLKQHLYDNCRGQTLYIDEMINLTKEWLQEQRKEIVQDANDRKIVLDYMNLVFDNLIEELEQ